MTDVYAWINSRFFAQSHYLQPSAFHCWAKTSFGDDHLGLSFATRSFSHQNGPCFSLYAEYQYVFSIAYAKVASVFELYMHLMYYIHTSFHQTSYFLWMFLTEQQSSTGPSEPGAVILVMQKVTPYVTQGSKNQIKPETYTTAMALL